MCELFVCLFVSLSLSCNKGMQIYVMCLCLFVCVCVLHSPQTQLLPPDPRPGHIFDKQFSTFFVVVFLCAYVHVCVCPGCELPPSKLV